MARVVIYKRNQNTEYRIVYSAIKHHTMFIAYNNIVRCTFTEKQNKFHVNDNIYNKINIGTWTQYTRSYWVRDWEKK